MTRLKLLYKKLENIINNKEKCFLVTKTWLVKAKTVREALEEHENFEHLDISIKEKK
jgi:hypothetical protein